MGHMMIFKLGCFFFFFFFFVRAALMLQSQQFGGKQAVADFTDYFLPSD